MDKFKSNDLKDSDAKKSTDLFQMGCVGFQ